MNNPAPYVFIFIAFIGVVCILSTYQCKSPSEQTEPTDDSHETDSNDDGNSETNPHDHLAKALATHDASINPYVSPYGTPYTIHCANGIKKITDAKMKQKSGTAETDVTQEVQQYCYNQVTPVVDCKVIPGWEATIGLFLQFEIGSQAKKSEHIVDPAQGSDKILDLSWSCESQNAESIFITDNSGGTINCPGKQIQIESAWYRRQNMIDNGKSNVLNLLNDCNGRDKCTITPTGFTTYTDHKVYFQIKEDTTVIKDCQHVSQGCRHSSGWCLTGTANECPGVVDHAYGETKELAIVYYCK